MPFNINSFQSEIKTNGVLQNNKYQVYVTPCSLMAGSSIITSSSDGEISTTVQDITSRMLMRAGNFMAPGISLMTADLNRYGYGISQKMPFNAKFEPMNISFLADKDGAIWQFWYQWMQLIFNFSGQDDGQGTIFNSSGGYNLNYKDDYSTTITLATFDNVGKLVQEIDYTEAYPFGIQMIPFNYDMDNTLVRINVAVTFTDYMIVGSTLG